jgi:hypothetical protein
MTAAPSGAAFFAREVSRERLGLVRGAGPDGQLQAPGDGLSGAEGLSMVVFTPVTPADTRAVEALIARGERSA